VLFLRGTQTKPRVPTASSRETWFQYPPRHQAVITARLGEATVGVSVVVWDGAQAWGVTPAWVGEVAWAGAGASPARQAAADARERTAKRPGAPGDAPQSGDQQRPAHPRTGHGPTRVHPNQGRSSPRHPRCSSPHRRRTPTVTPLPPQPAPQKHNRDDRQSPSCRLLGHGQHPERSAPDIGKHRHPALQAIGTRFDHHAPTGGTYPHSGRTGIVHTQKGNPDRR